MEGYARGEAEEILEGLEEKSLDELEVLFRDGVSPGYSDVSGETAGRFLKWNPANPWMVDFLVDLLFDSVFGRWTGKEFFFSFEGGDRERGRGVNLFNNGFYPRRFLFDTYITEARLDGEPSLCLDYRPHRSLMSRLVDYVKRIEPGVVLGRMYYNYPWERDSFLGYFSLCRLR